ncbi:hypothetical protein ACFS4T_16495 [Pseudomonas lini]
MNCASSEAVRGKVISDDGHHPTTGLVEEVSLVVLRSGQAAVEVEERLDGEFVGNVLWPCLPGSIRCSHVVRAKKLPN